MGVAIDIDPFQVSSDQNTWLIVLHRPTSIIECHKGFDDCSGGIAGIFWVNHSQTNFRNAVLVK